jgi:hypothetical protein
MGPDGKISELEPGDNNHSVTLTETYPPGYKGEKVPQNCEKTCDAGNSKNAITDTMQVTNGHPHSIIKTFQVDKVNAKVVDPGSSRAYDFVRVDAKYSKTNSFKMSYGNNPEKPPGGN